jgi:predicted alpha/beta superfamily hydrolase
MGIPTSLAFLGGLIMAVTGGHAGTASAMSPAESRVDSFRVVMPELGNRQRMVRVYLPKHYDAVSRAFPVLYLQDAQQLFSPGPFGDWLIDETLDRLSDEDPAHGLIVVGIDNSDRRWDEYGPWKNSHMHDWVDPSWSAPEQGGEGAAYVEFLTRTLKPKIDSLYRTLPDRANTAVGGSSMGGLIALYAGITRPDVFSMVMAMSTAVWFGEDGGPWLSRNHLLRFLADRRPPSNVRFYLDVGTNERSRDKDPDVVDAQGHPVSYPRAYVEGSEAVADVLQRGGVPSDNLRHVIDQGAIHNESAWSRRFEGAVRWLFR